MNELGNTLNDLLTEQQLKEYHSKEYPFNTNFLSSILLNKLKQDPDYEVWVPLFYCRHSLRQKDHKLPSVIYSPLSLISNKGRIARYRDGNYHLAPNQCTDNGYVTTAAWDEQAEHFTFVLHRALGSVFVAIPEELKLYHPKDLQVNHVDGNKSNFELGNLEWVTDSGNKIHAVENGLIKSGKDSILTKPVKGKVEFGPYAGYEFILHGLADYKKYGFTQQNIVRCCKGRTFTHKNCSWVYASEQDLIDHPNGLSIEIMGDLSKVAKRKKKV